MNNLDRISINSEKLLKIEELITLKGGIVENTTCVSCYSDPPEEEDPKGFLGSYYSNCPADEEEALEICKLWYPASQSTNYTCGLNCQS